MTEIRSLRFQFTVLAPIRDSTTLTLYLSLESCKQKDDGGPPPLETSYSVHKPSEEKEKSIDLEGHLRET